MVISLIYPSRGRAQKCYDTHQKWLMLFDSELTKRMINEKLNLNLSDAVETILSLDSNDPALPEYFRLMEGVCTRIIVNDNRSVVEATNNASKVSKGDVLTYTSDDFIPPVNWYKSVVNEFEGVNEPMLLKVDDCLQNFNVPVLTIPIMNRALYERLGYFWFPQYKSMFVDEDLYWTARKLGAIKFAPHLKFEHQHVSVGKAQDDETYRNSAKNWDQGKALFAKRKAAGFPI